MTSIPSLPRWTHGLGVSLALSACMTFSLVGPASASQDEMDPGQQPPATQPAGPQPLIQVITIPNLPPEGPPNIPSGPPPALPAQYAQPVGPYTMYMEVIASGPGETGMVTAPGCILDGVFKRGMKLVWRFEVYDMATGVRVTDRDGAQVMMNLPDGSTIPARFEQRGGGPNGGPPPDAPWTWVAVWYIPADYPLGPVNYSVTVTSAAGVTGTMMPATLGSRYPQIID
jgi:hypothetical protein